MRLGEPATPDQHVRFLGVLHWAWGAFNLVTAVAMASFALAAVLVASDGEAGSIASGVTAAGFLAIAVTAGLWAGLHAWCGQALRVYDRRGRLVALALALFNLLLFPFGTLLAGYALWVLLDGPVRDRFETA